MTAKVGDMQESVSASLDITPLSPLLRIMISHREGRQLK